MRAAAGFSSRATGTFALRAARGPVTVDGRDVVPDVHDTLDRMRRFADRIRSGTISGQGGAYTDVVNIGIGGSDLGPVMAAHALAPWMDGPRLHFISNVDGADAADTLKGLDPTTTLVVVASKTFTTIETMTNAATARDWMGRTVTNPASQFAALGRDWLARLNADPMPVSTVPGRTRGRHRATRFSLRVWDVRRSL